jgi:glycyl-tRNA synthetase beta chain
MKPVDLLLEIGVEEIPAWMIERACHDLKAILEKHLGAYALLEKLPGGKENVEALGAPRRLVAVARGVRPRQEDRLEEILGPPRSVAFDSVGAPTRAAESFAQKQGVPVARLLMVSTPKGECLAVKKSIPGRPALAILSEALPRVIQEIPWPRSMHWVGISGPRFIRPIRWIVALLGGKVVPFEIAGVKSGATSAGHRFLGKSRIAVRGPQDFAARLEKNGVLVHPAERRKKIEREVAALTRKHGLRVHPDSNLLEQVTYLNEFPTVILGRFEEAFLQLPEEILITVMRDHQKYFAVERRSGGLAPHFLAVINLRRDHGGLIQRGHERVLRSRFADARFFWETDQKSRLADHLPRLNAVTFESRLGSYGDKAARITANARWLAERLFESGNHQADVAAAVRAAELCKCDLVTEMVREFTELQGVVGGLYAQAQDEGEEVSRAVYDHYRPAGPDEELPRNLTGCIVSMADKLDTLAGCFAVGMVPSGSSDPYGLRRAASGMVRILAERRLEVTLGELVAAGLKSVAILPPRLGVAPEVEKRLMDFILDRVRFHFKERAGYAFDEINAVFAAGSDHLVDVEQRLEAVKAMRTTRNFEPLAVSFKRIRKILEKAGPAEKWRLPAVNAELLAEDAERDLHAAAGRAALHAGSFRKEGKYREALLAISNLRPVVDRFFDHVLVNAENEAVRRNRLTLLAGLLKEFSTIADFSEIVSEGKT